MTRSPSSSSLPDTNVDRTGELEPKQPKTKCRNPKNAESSNSGERKKRRYKGVTCRLRPSNEMRYDAHLWDNSWWNETRTKRGQQVYLGTYATEKEAACAFDLAALKYWGAAGAELNFPVETYEPEIVEMEKVPKEEYVKSLRRRSDSFSRGACEYRGVTRHSEGKWMARIGGIMGQKCLCLGLFESPEKAAQAYDKAVITYRGQEAVTNFGINDYVLESNLVPHNDGQCPLIKNIKKEKNLQQEKKMKKQEEKKKNNSEKRKRAPREEEQQQQHMEEAPGAPVLEAAGGQQDESLTGDDDSEFDPDSLFIDGDAPDEDPVAGA